MAPRRCRPDGPLLSNLYLHPFDQVMAQAGYTSIRYGDGTPVQA
jgi:hypothetical protein